MAFQILCLSGGGYLGLYSAAVLAAFEQDTGKPISESFDLIAGTSIGGIIALGLAAGATAAEIRDTMVQNGKNIFSNGPPPSKLKEKFQLATTANKPKYKAQPLKETIQAIIDPDLRIGDLEKRVIVPAVNLSKGQPQVFKTAHHESFVRDWRLKVVDVALATSAAPTYFPIHKIGGELFADGGLYANSPDLLALHEARHFLNQELADIRVLSVGTTTSNFSFSNAVGQNLGWAGWMAEQRLTSAMIASQQLNVDYMMQHMLGGAAYTRIDRVQSKEQERELRLDVATDTAKDDLLALAEASAREHLPKAPIRTMLSHQAAPAKFHHRGACSFQPPTRIPWIGASGLPTNSTSSRWSAGTTWPAICWMI
jgi:patatin-like phospholipase/acyl hydrolase